MNATNVKKLNGLYQRLREVFCLRQNSSSDNVILVCDEAYLRWLVKNYTNPNPFPSDCALLVDMARGHCLVFGFTIDIKIDPLAKTPYLELHGIDRFAVIPRDVYKRSPRNERIIHEPLRW